MGSKGVRVLGVSLMLAAVLGLSACGPIPFQLGVTSVNGQPAVVVGLCRDEYVSDVRTVYLPSETSLDPITTWEIKAKPPIRAGVLRLWEPRPGFVTTTPHADKKVHPDEAALVEGSSPNWPWTASAIEDLAKAKPGVVLIEGKYLSYRDYLHKWAICQQIKHWDRLW
jgi:hypothetical protein